MFSCSVNDKFEITRWDNVKVYVNKSLWYRTEGIGGQQMAWTGATSRFVSQWGSADPLMSTMVNQSGGVFYFGTNQKMLSHAYQGRLTMSSTLFTDGSVQSFNGLDDLEFYANGWGNHYYGSLD